ncbi:MAG: ATP-binding protein [Methanospirillum sp.]
MLSVLYYDRDPAWREQAERCFARADAMEVVPAETFSDATSHLRSRAFDVVVADPLDEEVLALLSIVRANEGSVPFILLMEPGHGEIVIDAFNSGLDRYVEKSGNPPDRFDALGRTVEGLVRRETESASLQRRNEELAFLSRTAMDFIGIENEEDLYRYIGDQVSGLVPDSYVVLFALDPGMGQLVLRGITPAESVRRVAREELGRDLVGVTIPLDADVAEVMRTALGCNRMMEGATSMYYGLFRSLSEDACNRIEGRLDIGKYYSMGFNCRDGLYGAITIAVRKGSELGNRDLIEAFVRQASVALLRQHVRTRLRESEARYRAVVESQRELICRFASDGTHLFANEAYCRFFRLDPATVIGRRFIPVIPEVEQRTRTEFFRSFTPAAPEGTIEHRVRLPDGATRWLQWHDSAFFDENGAITEFQSVGRDVTERREAEAALELLTAQLEQRVGERTAELEAAYRDLEGRTVELSAANRDLESFSHQVSHDLRTPLRAIDGYLGILMARFGPELSPDAVAYVGRAREGVHRAGRFLEGLLSLNRLSRKPLQSKVVDMDALVRAVIADTVPLSDGGEIELTVEQLPPCRADPEMLRHVFSNLIGNAVKFTRDRDPARIAVLAIKHDGRTVYQVRDNGVGFPPEHAAALFDDFARFHDARQFEGSGIGLALVRRIVERHGGRVWAEGDVDRGATFSFTLKP